MRMPNLDGQIQLFNDLVNSLYELHFPMQRCKSKALEVKSSLFDRANLDRHMAHKDWRRLKTVEILNLFV